MPFWSRRQPLHERLAREGGLGPEPEPRAPWEEVGIHGVQRLREWDTLATAQTELPGSEALFVALPDGTLLVEEGADGDLSPLAAAVEATVPPPYRALAVRQDATTWTVAARRIEVVELADDPGGEELELAWDGRERGYRVDGVPSFGGVRELERLGEGRFETWVVRASRLDGSLWEVSVAPL